MWRQWHCSTVCNMQNVLLFSCLFVVVVAPFYIVFVSHFFVCCYSKSKPHFHSTPVQQHSTVLDTIERSFIFTSDVAICLYICSECTSFIFLALFFLFCHLVSFVVLSLHWMVYMYMQFSNPFRTGSIERVYLTSW